MMALHKLTYNELRTEVNKKTGLNPNMLHIMEDELAPYFDELARREHNARIAAKTQDISLQEAIDQQNEFILKPRYEALRMPERAAAAASHDRMQMAG
jgi:hypothetical protein